MDTIYHLQQRADELRKKTETDSISAEMVGGLHADTLDYLSDLERNIDVLGVRRVYKTFAAMSAEGDAPTGTNGKALRYGQLVTVYDADNTSQAESGNIYAWQTGTGESAWLLVGNLANISSVMDAISQEAADRKAADEQEATDRKAADDQEATDRKAADKTLQTSVDTVSLALTNAQVNLGKKITSVENTVSTVEEHLNTLQTTVEGLPIPALGHTSNDAFPGDEGAALQTKVETMGDDIGTINGWREEMEESAAAQQELQRADGVVNVNTLLGHASQQVPLTFTQVLTQVWACEYDVKLPGVVLTWLGADGWRSKQWVTCGKQEETDWKTESNWTDYGGERQVTLTQDEYDALAAAGTLDADTYYNVLEE
jgi:hypothetical protein